MIATIRVGGLLPYLGALAALAAFAALLVPRGAGACDRPSRRPWQRLGAADLVVRAMVEEAPPGAPALVKVLATIAGRAPGAPGARLRVSGFAKEGANLRCGGNPAAVGQELLLLLFAPRAAAEPFALIDEVDGVVPLGSPLAAELLKQAPDRAGTPFRDAGSGLAVKLLASSPRVEAGASVDLSVLVRNVGKAPVTLAWRDWPRGEASACPLLVRRAGVELPGARNPISDADIAAYFSRHGRSYEVVLQPGGTHEFLLPRFNSAAPGWGYKEELDFLFHPLAQPGVYTVQARCRNLPAKGGSLETLPLELTVPAPAGGQR